MRKYFLFLLCVLLVAALTACQPAKIEQLPGDSLLAPGAPIVTEIPAAAPDINPEPAAPTGVPENQLNG